MSYKVIIAEKPSVAKAIADIVGASTAHRDGPTGYIEGNGYKVTWAFGHLVGLKSPEQMGFDRTTLPMYPDKWETKPIGKRNKEGKEDKDPFVEKQLKVLDSLFAGAERIIVATDAGREGELIFRYIYEYLGSRTPFDRLWVSSLTNEAISEGLATMKSGHSYDALSDAAHARSQADWLVGFNASRALRFATSYKSMISLGRVQTPTLAMICERFIQNKEFVPTPFWIIEVNTEKSSVKFSVQSDNHYTSEPPAKEDLKKVKSACQLKVEKVEKKHTSTKPPLLYDITALQIAANRKYGMTADETLKIAQELYQDKKVLSYPRTSSRYITKADFNTIPKLLQKMASYGDFAKHTAAFKGKDVKDLCKKSVNDSKVTDHTALLPTGNIPTDLTNDQKKVFDLVVSRMYEAFGENCESDITTVTLTAGGVDFKARGSVITYAGWKSVNGIEAEDESQKEGNEEEPSGRLPEMKEGELLPINNAEVIRKTDKPLPIYTDATLLGEMETCGKKIDDEELRESMKEVGIGTAATRAAIIEALIQRKYIIRDKKKIIPTELGSAIYQMVKGRKIADVKTTGEWERDLALVEQGKNNVNVFMKGITNFVGEIITDLKDNCKSLDGVGAEPAYKCPFCGKPMKNMKFSINCDAENGGCGFRIPREVAGKKLSNVAISYLAAGNTTPIVKGFTSKSGKKFDCALKVDKENRKVAFDIAPALPAKEYSCPICGKTMTKDGAKYTCDCGLAVWTIAGGKHFTEEQFDRLMKGEKVAMFNLKSKAGKTYNANFFINKEEKKMDSSFINKK